MVQGLAPLGQSYLLDSSVFAEFVSSDPALFRHGNLSRAELSYIYDGDNLLHQFGHLPPPPPPPPPHPCHHTPHHVLAVNIRLRIWLQGTMFVISDIYYLDNE